MAGSRSRGDNTTRLPLPPHSTPPTCPCPNAEQRESVAPVAPTMPAPRKRNPYADRGGAGDVPKRLRGGSGRGACPPAEPDDMDEAELYDDALHPPEPDAPPEEVERAGEEEGAVARADHRARWSRPAVPASAWRSEASDLNLQWLDVDMTSARAPLAENPNRAKQMPGASKGTVPVIRLYGVNETGNSVAVRIHGFTCYGYFALPRGCAADGGDANLGQVRQELDTHLKVKVGGKGLQDDEDAVLAVQYVQDKQSIMGYDPAHTAFLKVYVAMPGMLPKLKTIMEEGLALPGMRDPQGGEVAEAMVFQPFECNVPYVMRCDAHAGSRA